MGKVILKVDNISKMYRLGTIGTGTITHDINRWWHIIRGKEDPYSKIGEKNDRSKTGKSEYVWALNNISFEVNQGDVIGIVGKNGAGKSTLLKILSKITSPTKGTVKTKGRMASLLEVGTGFHPELTGRENIFLNGAILGMSKKEITSKLDQIISFSGCERYIDTPVKRYSSGMKVRLAFAVAAHLEPDILVIDEVLAVGDAEFQKKAIGKMKSISAEGGRTVLFVSHNMAAVRSICNKGILIQNGTITHQGGAEEIVNEYLKVNSSEIITSILFQEESGLDCYEIRINEISISPKTPTVNDKINFNFDVTKLDKLEGIHIAVDVLNTEDQVIFGSGGHFKFRDGKINVTCEIPANFLNDDTYLLNIYFSTQGMKPLIHIISKLSFEVKDSKRENSYFGKINGIIRPQLNWAQKT